MLERCRSGHRMDRGMYRIHSLPYVSSTQLLKWTIEADCISKTDDKRTHLIWSLNHPASGLFGLLQHITDFYCVLLQTQPLEPSTKRKKMRSFWSGCGFRRRIEAQSALLTGAEELAAPHFWKACWSEAPPVTRFEPAFLIGKVYPSNANGPYGRRKTILIRFGFECSYFPPGQTWLIWETDRLKAKYKCRWTDTHLKHIWWLLTRRSQYADDEDYYFCYSLTGKMLTPDR